MFGYYGILARIIFVLLLDTVTRGAEYAVLTLVYEAHEAYEEHEGEGDEE